MVEYEQAHIDIIPDNPAFSYVMGNPESHPMQIYSLTNNFGITDTIQEFTI